MRTLLFFLVFICLSASAQKQITISGTVSDIASGERLIGATVYVPGFKIGVTTNSYGFYSLTIPTGNHTLQASYVGYQTVAINIKALKDTVIPINLKTGIDLEEVTVKGGNRNSHPYFSHLNMQKLDMAKLADVPVLLGERDLLKSIQYLPGIKGGAENTAGYNVRGGSSDQNLILLDGVPVYNVYHLMGFFSVFNGEAIKNAGLYKGGIPARYGGHLSSVLDVSMKEGNMQKISGAFTISPVSASAAIEGPIKKDKASFIVSARRTFIDLPLQLIQKLQDQPYLGGYFFHDINAKTNWAINRNNRIYLSFYGGLDRNYYKGSLDNIKQGYRYQWGNTTSVLRWNSTLSPKLFSNTSVYYSSFNNTQRTKADEDGSINLFLTSSKLMEWCAKTDFDYYTSKQNVIRFGGKLSFLKFLPDINQTRSDETQVNVKSETLKKARSFEVYLEDEIKLGKLNANIGFRLANYLVDNKMFTIPEPRIALSRKIGEKTNISASYMRNSQYLHLLTNSSLGLPTDLWVASTRKIQPQKADQFTLGIEKRVRNNYTIGTELYYKKMTNVSRFNEGVSFLNGREGNWEENITIGQGEAYGTEWMVRKENGQLTWMFAYTLSWANQRFDNINQGKWFPFKYDRRHDISALIDYKIRSKRPGERKISLAFVFQTGNHITINDTETEGVILPGMTAGDTRFSTRKTYSEPNNFKMPPFHHLDLNYSVKKYKANGRGHEWAFSGYNIYNRLNPWLVYKDEGVVKQLSIFPFIPSVSYRYKF